MRGQQPLLRKAQPIDVRERAKSGAELALHEGLERHQFDPVIGGQPAGSANMAADAGKPHGPILEALGQLPVQRRHQRIGLHEVGLAEEDLDGRAVVVVGRHLGIEAEHFRAVSQPGGGIAKLRQGVGDHGSDECLVEAAGEIEADRH